ncbi:MAG: repressor LexA [Methylophaga sp.]|nr:MAG: repressor LexA [Methylophaga sp.]
MLTDRQQDTYNFIVQYFQEHGRAPLLSEVAYGIGLSSQGSVHNYIQALVNEGLIERVVGKSRGLRLANQETVQETMSIKLPVMGRIAAGRLIEAIPDETEIDLGEMFEGKDRFVLKVNGESMTGEGIMDGDYVVIQSQQTANHGDIVVALVDGFDATLKTMLKNADQTITLMPANDSFQPVTLDANRLAIQGVVVGQLRTYH